MPKKSTTTLWHSCNPWSFNQYWPHCIWGHGPTSLDERCFLFWFLLIIVSFSPTPPSKTIPLSSFSKTLSSVLFLKLLLIFYFNHNVFNQKWIPQQGNLCQCSVSCTVKECFLMFRGNLWRSSLCLFHLVLSLGTTIKRMVLSSSHPYIRCLQALIRSFLSLLFSRLNSLSSFSFSSYERCP